jgi:hypothetical protein
MGPLHMEEGHALCEGGAPATTILAAECCRTRTAFHIQGPAVSVRHLGLSGPILLLLLLLSTAPRCGRAKRDLHCRPTRTKEFGKPQYPHSAIERHDHQRNKCSVTTHFRYAPPQFSSGEKAQMAAAAIKHYVNDRIGNAVAAILQCRCNGENDDNKKDEMMPMMMASRVHCYSRRGRTPTRHCLDLSFPDAYFSIAMCFTGARPAQPWQSAISTHWATFRRNSYGTTSPPRVGQEQSDQTSS